MRLFRILMSLAILLSTLQAMGDTAPAREGVKQGIWRHLKIEKQGDSIHDLIRIPAGTRIIYESEGLKINNGSDRQTILPRGKRTDLHHHRAIPLSLAAATPHEAYDTLPIRLTLTKAGEEDLLLIDTIANAKTTIKFEDIEYGSYIATFDGSAIGLTSDTLLLENFLEYRGIHYLQEIPLAPMGLKIDSIAYSRETGLYELAFSWNQEETRDILPYVFVAMIDDGFQNSTLTREILWEGIPAGEHRISVKGVTPCSRETKSAELTFTLETPPTAGIDFTSKDEMQHNEIYYDLNGHRVTGDKPEHGIYIRTQGGGSEKIIK